MLLDDSINIINPDFTGFNSGSLVLELANAKVDGSGNVFFNGIRFGAVTTDNTLDGASNVLTYAITFVTSGVTNAQVDPLIQAIRFTNSSDTPPTTQRTITYTVTDTEGDQSHNTLALRIETTRAPELTDLTPSLTVSGPDANSGGQPNTCREAERVWSNCFGTRPLGNNGDIYDGMWLKGRPHGEGTLTRTNGATYSGQWQNGEQHGLGSFTAANGAFYLGNWIDGKRSGQGTYVGTDGSTYTGKWRNDKKHGRGTLTYPNGTIFIGRFKNDKPDKDRDYVLDNGSPARTSYIGELKDGKRHGKGLFTDANGNTYNGNWENGKRNGTGSFVWGVGPQAGMSYVGDWRDNKFDGKGTLTYPDGSSYMGEWKNGERHGRGTVTSPEGKRFVGEWDNGKLVKKF